LKLLIVNADDFGLAESINEGIIKGYREGFITSTSLMCSAPAFDSAVEQLRSCPGLGVGIHLTLVGGVKPVLPAEKIPGLVTSDGVFLDNYVEFAKKFYSGQIQMEEVAAELAAQIERGLATGLKFTHLDSHQHLHVLPGMPALIVHFCQQYGFHAVRIPGEDYFWRGGFACGPVRMLGKCGLTFCSNLFRSYIRCKNIVGPNHFFGMVAGGNLNETLVGNILDQLPEGVSEIMTHPGLDAEHLAQKFKWGYHWEDELQAFLSEKNKQKLSAGKIKLINFGGLTNA
jgi:hopanoid biosynthesis associated protein HpnK